MSYSNAILWRFSFQDHMTVQEVINPPLPPSVPSSLSSTEDARVPLPSTVRGFTFYLDFFSKCDELIVTVLHFFLNEFLRFCLAGCIWRCHVCAKVVKVGGLEPVHHTTTKEVLGSFFLWEVTQPVPLKFLRASSHRVINPAPQRRLFYPSSGIAKLGFDPSILCAG